MAIIKAKKPINPSSSKKKELVKKAEANTSVTKGTSRDQKVVKEGTPNDHSTTHNINKITNNTVGINIGLTKNMGDFESLRIDCWLTDEVLANETHEQAFERISEVAIKVLEKKVEELS